MRHDQDGPRELSRRKEVVSVVIPCYNQGQFVGEAIESVLAQSYEPKQIIVVNDGSTDSTAATAGKYRVRLVHQRNLGESAARNRGLRESSGSYLIFLDADDRLLPGAIEAGIAELGRCPECAFVFGGYRHIANDGSFLRPQHDPVTEQDLYKGLLRYNHIGMGATVMFRRDVLQAVGGFDTSFERAADYELYLRIARIYPIRRHDRIIAEYRKHGGGISENPAPMLRYVLAALRTQRTHVASNPEYGQAWREGIRNNRKWYIELIAQRIRTPPVGTSKTQLLGLWMTLLRHDPRIFGYLLLRSDNASNSAR